MTSSMFFKNTRQHSKEDHEVTRARIYVFQNNTNDHYKSKLLKVPTKTKNPNGQKQERGTYEP